MTQHHLGESAELYALGALDSGERDIVRTHVAGCIACARLLGAAERTVAAMDRLSVPQVPVPPALDERFARESPAIAASPPRHAPPQFRRYAALAAAFVVFAGGAVVVRDETALRATNARDDRALRALSESHFSHATFHAARPGLPIVKAIFGRGAHPWIFVIADTSDCGCRAVGIDATGERELGSLVPGPTTSSLFVGDAPGLSRIELRSGTRALESVPVTRGSVR